FDLYNGIEGIAGDAGEIAGGIGGEPGGEEGGIRGLEGGFEIQEELDFRRGGRGEQEEEEREHGQDEA
ncbi:hypothetical protein Ancab_028772, partial [Ancistrocladus abbreviatus]